MKKLAFLITITISQILLAQNVGIGTSTPQTQLHILSASNEAVRIDATSPYLSLYSSGVYKGYFWKSPISIELGSAAGSNLPITFAPNGNQLMYVGINGNVGIGTTTPFSPLGFGNSSGDIISLNGTAGNNYGFGVQLGLLQIHANVEGADIAFGYGSSSSFNQRMRIINAGSTGMELNGRIVLKNGTLPLDINATPGIWLNKPDNSSLLGFMGTQNNQNIGFYGGPANGGWGFVYNTINSRVGIGTSNPSEKLHVEGTTLLNGIVEIGSPGPGGTLRVFGTTTLESNVGIGTAPSAFSLEVNGSAGKPGGGSWSATSDARMKENVLPYTDGLSTLLKINPVKYHYNQLSGYDTKPEHIGVLAQDLKSFAPYMVGSFQKKGENYYSVDNSAMTYILINAVKEQQLIIDKQQQQIDELKEIVQQLVNK